MPENITITYDLLFDILRYEKSREELQSIDHDFFNNVLDYLKSKEEVLLHSQTPVAERELTRIQLNNIKKILLELYERREKKIINLALYKIKTGSDMINTTALLEEEKVVFDSLVKVISKYRDSIINNILNMQPSYALPLEASEARPVSVPLLHHPEEDEQDSTLVKSVRFVKPVPRFLGPELENYGPFEEHDIVSLPSKIANILIRKERAEEIKQS